MIFDKNDRLLIVAAHPDDEILGCGGLLSKYSNKMEIAIIFIAEGESCRYKNSESKSLILNKVKYREECARKALELFNVKDISFNTLRCGRLDSVSIIDINKIIEEKLFSYKPSIVLSHYSHDTNNDHRIVARSVQMATRPVTNFNINILSYETLSSTEWNLENPFKPNFFIELSEIDVENKINALKIYDGEIRDFPHSRSPGGIRSLSRYRGMQVGVSHAEAFYSNRIKIG